MPVLDRWTKRENGKRVHSKDWGRGKRWQAYWVEPDGAPRKRSFDTRDAAAAFALSQESKVQSGEYIARDVPLSEVWALFEPTKRNLSKSSRWAYTIAWERHIGPQFGDAPVSQIKPAEVKAWLPTLTRRGKPLSVRYSNYLLMVLKALLDHAVEADLLARNRLKSVRPRKAPQTHTRYLTHAEAGALLVALGENSLVARIMLHTGMRRGEVAGLEVADIDFKRRRIRVSRDIDSDGNKDTTKSGRHRDVPISPFLDAYLRAAVKGKGRTDLVVSKDGKPWTKDLWRYPWYRARKAIGIPDLDTHELRHTAASWAIQAGANVKTVQRMLGHASAAVTLDIYGHLWDESLDDVAARMDALWAEMAPSGLAQSGAVRGQ